MVWPLDLLSYQYFHIKFMESLPQMCYVINQHHFLLLWLMAYHLPSNCFDPIFLVGLLWMLVYGHHFEL
jgi:hypothetical protein